METGMSFLDEYFLCNLLMILCSQRTLSINGTLANGTTAAGNSAPGQNGLAQKASLLGLVAVLGSAFMSL